MAQALAHAVLTLLRERGLTLAVAETDTGGLVGHWLTDIPGCSAVFKGSAMPYHNTPKTALLGVPPDLLHEHGSVSEATAVAMAQGTQQVFAADIAVSETGISCPTGGSDTRPVGSVWIACAGPGARLLTEHHVWNGDREQNKRQRAEQMLRLVQRHVDGFPPPR